MVGYLELHQLILQCVQVIAIESCAELGKLGLHMDPLSAVSFSNFKFGNVVARVSRVTAQ